MVIPVTSRKNTKDEQQRLTLRDQLLHFQLVMLPFISL